MDSIVHLTAEDLVVLHEEALTLGNGGAVGIRSLDGLMSAAMQPYQTVFGDDAYPTIPEKAAAHAYFLSESQPFVDGNKRTAALAMIAFLDANGYELFESDDLELAVMLMDLGSRIINQGEFFGWVINHTRLKPADVLPFKASGE